MRKAFIVDFSTYTKQGLMHWGSISVESNVTDRLRMCVSGSNIYFDICVMIANIYYKT